MKQDFSSASMGATIVLFITIAVDILLFVCMFGMCTNPKDEENGKF
jgi:hypothetical protein